MDLTTIQNPNQIKNLSHKELVELAKDIRKFLIENVSKTGGHLSSNLGVVELTIALHYCFDSPTDKLIFDVGHQSYVHKILTGRSGRFLTLRQFEGLSGFQKRCESEHDVWEAGHSSTSLSAALGMAISRDLKGLNHHVIPIIGDGALTSGLAYEALNHIGMLQKNIIIIFNDKNMSISQNVGAITQGFSRLRASKSYHAMKHDIKDVLSKNIVGTTVLKGMTKVRDSVKQHVVDSSIFGELGLEYIGPVDGHDIKALQRVFDIAKKHQGPIVVHVSTIKGKGYPYSELDRDGRWHGVNRFDPDTGISEANIPASHASWSEVVSETMITLAKKNQAITMITPAMITGAKLERFFGIFPERSFDCGIAEEHACTLAAGQAIAGLRPFVSIYSSFLQRAYDQINHDICRMNLPVVLGIDRAGLVGEDGDTHHGVFDIGILRHLPNITIAQPIDAEEMQHMLYTAFSEQKPFAIRYPRGHVPYQPVKEFKKIDIGTWTWHKSTETPKVIVITYGMDVLRLFTRIESNKLPVWVINARFIKPLDQELLKQCAAFKVPVVIYEPDMLSGGLSSAISEWCTDQKVRMNITRIGIKDTYIAHGATSQLRKNLQIDTNSVIEVILKLLEHNE